MSDPSQYATPSRNPADDDSLAGVFRLVLTKFLQGVDDMLPAKVIAYNADANTAQVQPLIVVTTTDNQQIPRAQIASVPVFQISMGGFVINFPCNPGDLGWVKASDRDISIFKQTGQQAQPNTQRKHSFEDAIFIPQAARSLITIAAEDVGNLVLQNYAGTCKIALWPNLIKILAPKGVGIGGTPNPSAILDLQSTTQAFIYPRMTTAQRNAIPNPVEGMTIYNTSVHGVQTYKNTGWP
jgi:Phage protein Gp138 N-terminal domain